ncbi:unnamed protein product [Parnassius apollo]|uniref:(apollo) hypothetical protein n=1 Tax=Parnassius apollo TaxID=110799 RepID=A0A8S3W7U0_PARAO|nr:unnamed protein product [Parnassius apollo]
MRQVKCRDQKGSRLRQRQHHQEQQLRQIQTLLRTLRPPRQGEVTTTTETTVATVTTAASEENGQKNEAAQKEATKKTPKDIPDKGVHGSAPTLKPKRVHGWCARSMNTTSSSARRRELEAREELARMELKQAQAAAKLARVRLALAQCEEEDSVDDEQEDRTAQVQY